MNEIKPEGGWIKDKTAIRTTKTISNFGLFSSQALSARKKDANMKGMDKVTGTKNQTPNIFVSEGKDAKKRIEAKPTQKLILLRK